MSFKQEKFVLLPSNNQPRSGQVDKIIAVSEEHDCVFFENGKAPYSFRSVKLHKPSLKVGDNNTVYVNIVERKYSRGELIYFTTKAILNNRHSSPKEIIYWINENLF